jgi:hypothetical protein
MNMEDITMPRSPSNQENSHMKPLLFLALELVFATTLLANSFTVTFSAAGAFSKLDSVSVIYPAIDTQFVMGGNDTLSFLQGDQSRGRVGARRSFAAAVPGRM